MVLSKGPPVPCDVQSRIRLNAAGTVGTLASMDEKAIVPRETLDGPLDVATAASPSLQSSIEAFHPALGGYLARLGLPTEDVLVPVEERRKVISSLESALDVIPISDRQKAVYLTRFTVAIAVGLFDGALTYLWNETIKALRSLVANFDLAYFYSVAEQISPRNKNFQSEEDLTQVADHDLLEACRRIGLLSDVNFHRLEHVNYMRNHASAAHPTDHRIDGFEMMGLLTVCLKHAITAEPQHAVIQMKLLLQNIRTHAIPTHDACVIGADIAKLGAERIDDFLWTIFGIYVDPKQSSDTRANIEMLAPYTWPASSEDIKYQVGARYGTYRKSAEIARKDAADRFLKLVSGTSYKDVDSLAGELIENLGNLKTIHYGWNNFYGEYTHAKMLGESLPSNGVIPRAARPLWVKVIATCFIGNGMGYREGVDESALPYYKKYIDRFTEPEIIEFLYLFSDNEFLVPLGTVKCDRRTRTLARDLLGKTTTVYVKRALQAIIDAPQGTIDGIWPTKDFKDAIQYVVKSK